MAVGVSRINRIASFVLEKAIPRISNELKRNDGIVGVFGAKNRIQIVDGGDLFEERVEYQENTNFGHRTKFAQIPTAQQDNWLTAKYGQATLSGAAVLNDIENAQNRGEFAISSMIEAMIDNATNTSVRQVADALRAATPGNNDPESIQSMVEATAFGSQTSTTGGLSRSTYDTWWQNQYDNTAADTSANTGIEVILAFYWNSVAKGASMIDQPDFGLTTGTIFAALSAFGDNQRRYQNDEDMQKLGFRAIKLLNMSVIADPSITAGYFYLLNTNFLRLKVLRTPQMKNAGFTGETAPTIPISAQPFQKDIDSLNSYALMHATYNLVSSSLQRQGVMDNVS